MSGLTTTSGQFLMISEDLLHYPTGADFVPAEQLVGPTAMMANPVVHTPMLAWTIWLFALYCVLSRKTTGLSVLYLDVLATVYPGMKRPHPGQMPGTRSGHLPTVGITVWGLHAVSILSHLSNGHGAA